MPLQGERQDVIRCCTMRFSEYFDLGLTQPELDFVDIDLDGDIRLFLDPYALRGRGDPLAVQCVADIRHFFQRLLDALREGDLDRARTLLGHLHEPNETRLGYSANEARGSGVGSEIAEKIFEALTKSKAIETGFIRDISDTELLVDGIGPDRVSDLSTNIVRQRLIGYTQAQCLLHNVPMRKVASGPLWDAENEAWREDYVDLPVYQRRERILLVPKALVRRRGELSPREYYDQYVLDYLHALEMSNPATELGRMIRGARHITKKELKEKYGSGTKGFLLQFSQHHPEVLSRYKEEKGLPPPLTAQELLENFDPKAFARVLSERLREIPAGPEHATTYHRFVIGLLSFLLYPNLLYPVKEAEINEGRKRIDILYENGVHSGVFQRFTQSTARASTYIPVECKNYTREIGNPEVDQLIARFSNQRGWLGLLICRANEDPPGLTARCRDAYHAGLGCILPLDDANLLTMLRHVENGDYNAVDGHLSELFRRVVV